MIDKLFYICEDLEKDVMNILLQIKLSKIKFDYIAGIARGGLVPATFLSHRLNIPMLTLRCSLRDHKTDLNFPEISDIQKNDKILLVDDIVDSGETFSRIMDSVWFNPENFKIASLFYNSAQTLCEPNFYANEINRNTDNRWIHFFWEYNPTP